MAALTSKDLFRVRIGVTALLAVLVTLPDEKGKPTEFEAFIKKLGYSAKMKLQMSQVDMSNIDLKDASNVKVDPNRIVDFQMRLLLLTLCDEEGKCILEDTPEALKALEEVDPDVLAPLLEAAQSHNGMKSDVAPPKIDPELVAAGN